jgi:hypothetical protein
MQIKKASGSGKGNIYKRIKNGYSRVPIRDKSKKALDKERKRIEGENNDETDTDETQVHTCVASDTHEGMSYCSCGRSL